jgi:putative DNA primase/helicase
MADESPSAPATGDPAAAFVQADAANWKARLQRHPKTGLPLPTFFNVELILSHHPAWIGVLGLDEFSGRTVKRLAPPFPARRASVGEWSDEDDRYLRSWLASEEHLNVKPADVFEAVQTVAHTERFHEVRAYLEELRWDQVPRLCYWLAAYLGAVESDYTAKAGTKWMVSAVARVFRPGCKADHVLILEGEQGTGKSTALKILGGEWFTDAPFRLADREGWMVIRGKWIVELAELNTFNRAEVTAAKLFFSQYADRYRAPWGKRAIDVPRQCVFAGTTNQFVYLKDDTGNRRYWPVRCGDVDLTELRADRDQLWAEAVALYRAGESWHPAADELKLFEEEQDQRMVQDAYSTVVRGWLADDPNRLTVTMADVLGHALKLDAGRWTHSEQTRVGQIMTRIGWKRVRWGSEREYLYVRPGFEDQAREQWELRRSQPPKAG